MSEKKNTLVTISLSKAELARLKAMAKKKTGGNLSKLVRETVLK